MPHSHNTLSFTVCCSTYYDYQNLPKHAEEEVGAVRVEDLKQFLSEVDVLTINAPLHEGTLGLINKEKLSWMKKGAWIVNTARGAICVAEDVAEAVKSGHIAGYAGDVWNHQRMQSCQIRLYMETDAEFLSCTKGSPLEKHVLQERPDSGWKWYGTALQWNHTRCAKTIRRRCQGHSRPILQRQGAGPSQRHLH